MKPAVKYFCYITLVVTLIITGISFYFVNEVIAFTPNSEDEVRQWRKQNTFEEIDWSIEDISFKTYVNSIENSGEVLHLSGVFIPSKKQASSEAPSIIALHGKGSNRIGVLRFGYLFHQLGFNVLIYDQRHHGRSDGKYTTYGYYESYDVKAAIAFLEEKGINTERLGVIGESFGAATSLMAGAIENKIDFVIADSSYTDMPNAVKDNAWRMNYLPSFPIPDIGFYLASKIADFDPWSVSPISALQGINKPVLLVHCDKDVWAYPKYAYQLYEASDKQLTEFKMFSDCEHVAAYDDYTDEYTNMVKGFIERHLPEFL